MARNARLAFASPGIPTTSGKTIEVKKQADRELWSDEYRTNRKVAMTIAGGRCQYIIENGTRCCVTKATSMLYCDHIVERVDGGSDDVSNLQALCPRHHQIKTLKARKARAHGDTIKWW